MPRQIDSVSRQQDEFPLPPRLEVFSLATDYFKHLNQAIPLFQHDQFFKIIEAWYQDPPVRDAPSWAVINVVMALSLRHMPLERAPESNYLASACISHAQSVMESLIYRDQDLKGLQVLLSLCIFFFGSSYPQPAFIFIATAVKLVHRMKLHTKAKDNEFNGEIVSQRKCLFWITYIIDREMSAHSFEPYLLHDDDIDVEVYGLSQEDDAAGNLTVREDGSSISLFGLRIQLARIQGKIYDLIHSVRAQKISINQKNAATERLHQILKEWYTLIPEPFSLSTAPLDESAHWLRNLLHIEYYQSQSNSTPAVSSTCTLHAAVTVLLANTLTVSEHDLHDHLDADIKTIQASLSEIERRLQDREIPVLRMALNMSYDLSTRATAALARFYESSSIEAFWDVGVALN
ncbi:Fc.00g072450.m01.CDS01 [Cosmosporella sp. VM-42]